jgi:predicted XRE-type DNA-binding protein
MKNRKSSKKKKDETSVEIGFGSVYEQLGLRNHEEMLTKANLVTEINNEIKKKKLTQTGAAKILKITQPKLSALLRGNFRGYSIERLIHFLNKLGKDVDIVVRSKPETRKARVNVFHSNTDSVPNVPMAAKGHKD